MVRSLTVAALALVALSGCFPRVDPATRLIYFSGTYVEPPPHEEKIMHATTAYAYAPEKVDQPPFDKRAARDALAKVDVSACGAREDGHVKVTFANDGTVSAAKVDWPHDLAGDPRSCVEREFAKARVLAFDSQPVTLGASFRGSR